MAGNLRKHRGIIYKLQRDWGLQVYIYRPTITTQNLLTGELVRGYEVVSVRKAPVLPANLQRSFVYDLAYIAVSKNFTEGAFFDNKSRMVILDTRLLPKNFEPTMDDFAVIKTQKYEIKGVQFIEEFAAYRLSVVALENERKTRWLVAKNAITLTPSPEGEI